MRSLHSITQQEIASFRRKIFRFYAKHRRDLPWRNTTDPYRVTVSELMLQQTQVERVLPKYEEWISLWPNWHALSQASNEEILCAWSGLGYNRRALYLRKLAVAILNNHGGKVPHTPELLEKLPGIGPYTSRAILIFAFNKPLATVDTNIRRVLLHSFGLPSTLSPKGVQEFAERLLPKRRSRDWHNALMDYSRLMLPKQIASIPPLSRQSKFEGSARQVRGEIIRRLVQRQPVILRTICRELNREFSEVEKITDRMVVEGLVRRIKGRVWLTRNE